MADLRSLLRFWRALDDRFERTDPAWWGAVVTDRRFPTINEANYARVETREPGLSLADVESMLLPALRRSGCERAHVVLFFPEELTDLVAEASTRGEKIAWDLVMRFRGPSDPDDGRVAEIHRFDETFWTAHRESAEHLDISDGRTLSELQAVERDLMLPAGKRWFVVREEGRAIAFASLLILEGVAFVDHVVTLPPARRRGHATALTRRILSEAHRAGAEATYLLAEPDGVAAAMYERLGFARVTHLASWVSPRANTHRASPGAEGASDGDLPELGRE